MTLARSGGKGRLLTGARVRFTFNGKMIGYASGITVTESIEFEPIEVIDNIEVEEHVPIAYRVSFSATLFKIVGSTLKSEGLMPSNGADAEEHLTNILLHSGKMKAQLEDTKTNKIFGEFQEVKVTSHNWTINARGVVGEDVEFVAIRLADESELV